MRVNGSGNRMAYRSNKPARMTLALSPQTVEAIVNIISGGNGNSATPSIGIYRSGPKIEAFMRACGVRMSIGNGSRMPALAAAVEDVVTRQDVHVLRQIIEAAVSPADFLDDPERGNAVIEHLNRRLAFDQLVLRRRGAKIELVDALANAPIISALAEALAPINFDTVSRDLERALANADSDPEDAVTSACSVVESVCRSIIVALGVGLPAKKDIQSLYKTVREHLALDPGGSFRSDIVDDVRLTLSGLSSTIQGVGNLRTHGGDAHGRERGFARSIDPRIARLAIHTASAVALFLIETWQLKNPGTVLTAK
jgi:hypothetical protein